MMKRDQTRRALIHSLLAGTIVVGSVGCSSTRGFSLASINPFSKNDASEMNDPAAGPSFGESIAASTDGARDTMSSLGTSAKTAVASTTGAVKGMFASARSNNKEVENDSETPSSVDPLSLSNKPEKVSVDVFLANGRLWESTGNTQKAMESFTKALESEPGNADALGSIARLHFRNGEHTQAANFFGRAIKSAPEDAGLYNDLGLTLSKMGNHGAAAETLQRALTLAPGTSRYANNLASVLYDGGQAESAFGVLQQNNKPAVAHFNMAYLHQKNGMANEARTHLNEALKYEPQSVSDSSVKRAVTRSREMLAKLDGTSTTVAQASSQATIAALPASAPAAATAGPVRQTSQSFPSASNPYQAPTVKAASTATAQMLPPSMQGSPTYGVVPSYAALPPATANAAPATANAAPAAAETAPATGATKDAPEAKVAPVAQPAKQTKPAETKSGEAGFELPPGFNPSS